MTTPPGPSQANDDGKFILSSETEEDHSLTGTHTEFTWRGNSNGGGINTMTRYHSP